MTEMRNRMATAAAVGLLASCGSGTLPTLTPPPPEIGEAQEAADRFIPYFEERCVAPLSAGTAPDTNLLIPATEKIIRRYPRAGDYVELNDRLLSFWMEPQDALGSVVLVLETTPVTDRCAVMTDGFTAEAFAGKLKSAYPEYLARGDDAQVVDARVSVPGADGDRRSRVFTTYHDPALGVSALILTVSEREG